MEREKYWTSEPAVVSLIIKLAKTFPKSFLTGIDYWGGNGNIRTPQCQQNAEIEGAIIGLIYKS